MRVLNNFRLFLSLILTVGLVYSLSAQVSNYRPYDQNGINIFEAPVDLTTAFTKPFVRVGGSFTQQFQALDHGNEADVILDADGNNTNELYGLGNGFNLATANLALEFQIEDGIRVSLESYMSSRHHSEFWVKGGYVQIDRLPMFNNTDWFDQYFRVKLGHMEVNYGDQHFRRTDNGNAIWNPFVGNYILDAFTTEIGGEIYAFPNNNVMAMVGVTNGLIKGDVTDKTRKASIYGKLAFDKDFNGVRFRLSGSAYMNPESGRNTLFGGDRAGGRFYEVMEAAASQGDFSGRINPGFSTNVTSWQIAPFVKVGGLEVFATYEQATGYASNDPKKEGAVDPEKRSVSQIAVEGVYRFLPREQMYIGARYNTVSGELNSRIMDDVTDEPLDLTVNRLEVAAGWFPTPNLLLKASYVNQDYADYPSSNILHEGYFKGVMVEAVVGF